MSLSDWSARDERIQNENNFVYQEKYLLLPDFIHSSSAIMSLQDIVSVIIHCPRHDKIAFKPLTTKQGLYLPFKELNDESAVESTVREILDKINPNSSSWTQGMDLMSQTRVYLNRDGRKVDNWMFQVCISSGSSLCCQDLASLTWIPVSFLSQDTDLWAPESISFGHPHSILPDLLNEVEVTSTVSQLFAVRETQKTTQTILIAAAGFSKEKLTLLFQEFFAQTWPSVFMSRACFSDWMTKIGWNSLVGETQEELVSRVFQSFREKGTNHLTFHDFVVGMACYEGHVQHGGSTGYPRLVCVFNYYDSSRKGLLVKEDMLLMKNHIEQLERKSHAKQGKSFHPDSLSYPLDLKTLIKDVNDKKIQGTSLLCRRDFDVFARRIHCMSQSFQSGFLCQKHRPKTVHVAEHSVGIHAVNGKISGYEFIPKNILDDNGKNDNDSMSTVSSPVPTFVRSVSSTKESISQGSDKGINFSSRLSHALTGSSSTEG